MDLPFFTHLLNVVLMIGTPLALAFYLQRRFHLGWRIWWIGAATFVISQVGHIPFNALLTRMFQTGTLPTPPAAWHPYFNPIVLGLSAGLFEELMRAAVYRWWARDARSWRKGVYLGAGHGGIEAILLGVLALYALIQMTALRDTDLSTVIPAAQLQLATQQVTSYWSAPWTLALLGGLERIMTQPIQIACSVIVLQAFTRRQPWWVALAVIFHAVVDALAVYFVTAWSGFSWGSYAVEGVLAVFALISLAIIFLLRQPEPIEPVDVEDAHASVVPAPLTAADIQSREVAVSEEKLDQSRFQ